MKRMLIVLLLCGSMLGQSTGGRLTGSKPWQFGSALPATCAIGDGYFLNTGTVGLYTCNSGNTWSIAGGATFANPTGSVGTSAVNGVATTAMRSDAAPALNLAITPTWTANHLWNSGGASSSTVGFADFAKTWTIGTVSGQLRLTDTTDSFPALSLGSTEVRIGSTTNISANQSRLYVFGGVNGANQDIQGDSAAGAAGDQATIELEGSDYQTNTTSVLLQYKGVNATGTTLGFANANLGRLFWGNAATALVYTSNTTPIVFGTNSLERMRLLNGYQLNVGVAGTGSGILGFNGSTSGTATLTAPAVAGTVSNPVVSSNAIQVPLYQTASNCAVNSASPAACGSAPTGVIAIPTTTVTYTVNTTAVTANSRIFLEDLTDNTGIPSAPTCTALASFGAAQVSTRSAGTSFTISLPSTAGTTCFNYLIIN